MGVGGGTDVSRTDVIEMTAETGCHAGVAVDESLPSERSVDRGGCRYGGKDSFGHRVSHDDARALQALILVGVGKSMYVGMYLCMYVRT